VIVHGRVWTGTDGEFIPDQMQYLAWVRDAANHGLASDLFVLRSTPHDYLQPAVEGSAALTALGVAPWLSLLLWKPVAVLGVFFAIRAYLRRQISDPFAYKCALALALFFGFFAVLGDEWLPFWSWGYTFGLMAIAAMIVALLAYHRARSAGRLSVLAPVLGMLAGWLHPWQGEIMILVLVCSELVTLWEPGGERGDRVHVVRRLALFGSTLIATALPLVYYAALEHYDAIWRLGRAANDKGWSIGGILLSLAPLLIAAAFAYRHWPRTFLGATTRFWPLAAFAVYGLSEAGFGATPLHAFAGITIPLALLAVEGVRSVRWRLPHPRLIAVLVVALATIPASVHMLYHARSVEKHSTSDPNFITHDEQRALNYVARDRQPGSVLSDFYIGMLVPEMTGRHTYIGDYLWSLPDYKYRFGLTFQLINWPYVPPSRGALYLLTRWEDRMVLSTHARFVVSDCHTRAYDLQGRLKPISLAIHHFGCATVYQINPLGHAPPARHHHRRRRRAAAA
jgi:hypothetical protein